MNSNTIFNIIAVTLTIILTLTVIITQSIYIKHLEKQIYTTQIEQTTCKSTLNSFKNNLNKLCEKQFEKMGC